MATITITAPTEAELNSALNTALINDDTIDSIVFAPNLAGSTIRLSNPFNVYLQTGEFLFINGDADGDGVADITISGDVNGNNVADAGDVNILEARGGGSLTLSNVTLTNGYQRGADGGIVGMTIREGGDAASVIYSTIAALSLNRVEITNSTAVGGDFSTGAPSVGVAQYSSGDASTVHIASGSARFSEVLFDGVVSTAGSATINNVSNITGGDAVAGIRNDGTLFAQDVGFANSTAMGAQGGYDPFNGTGGNGGDGVVGVLNTGDLRAEANFNGGVASILLGENNTAVAGQGGDNLNADGFARVGVRSESLNASFQQGTSGASGADTIDQSANTGGIRIHGFGGNDTITGGSGADVIRGGAGNDALTGGGGADTLDGGGGNDNLNGGAGANDLTGGEGNDILITGDGDDVVRGGEGNDFIFFGGSYYVLGVVSEKAYGGEGGDFFVVNDGVSGTVGFYGGEGTDAVSFGLSSESINFTLGAPGLQSPQAGFLGTIGIQTDSIENLGGSGNDDTLTGDGGANLISGEGGGDFITGGGGADTLLGQAGGDTLLGGEGDDSLDGGSEADFLRAGAGTNTVNGGDDNDTLAFSEDFADITVSQSGDAVTITTATETTTATNVELFQFGAAGTELKTLAEVIAAIPDGGDTMTGGGGTDTMTGGGGTDTMTGGGGTDTMTGGGGTDTMTGGGGTDTTDGGGAGDPNLFTGTPDADVIRATTGDDTILGLAGDDRLTGRGGDDLIRGQGGDDIIKGNGGSDRLFGNGGEDNIRGGGGGDNIRGGGGADVIRGNGGADNLRGGGGADQLIGSGGDDTVNGGGGADTINGGRGADQLRGGGGDDVFQFTGSSGSDVIIDFRQGQDLLQILSGANGFGALTVEQQGAYVLISFAQTEITIRTDAAAAFTEDDFIF